MAFAALMALAFSATAQAVTYATGTALETHKQTTSVAVNQSSGDLYVASAGSEAITFGVDGAVQRFSSSGAELPCSLNPVPSHPAGLAINPDSGDIYSVNFGPASTDSELRTYLAGCGSELAGNSGTANTIAESSELTVVSMAHPLLVGQGVSAPGIIPTAVLTGDVASASPLIKNVNLVSGTLAVGQAISATGVSTTTTIAECIPDCSAPSELELSANASNTVPGASITARTTVTAVDESNSTAILSNPAEATETSAHIFGTAWHIEAAATAPIGQPTADGSGNIYWPNRNGNKLQKLAPWGEELLEGSFPITSGVNRPAAVARDAEGNLYVTTAGAGIALSCTNTTNGKLKKLQPNGASFPEGGPIGPESVFAGLTGGVTTVAVDKQTGNVYVGRGCGATFKVEIYGPGGGKLAENIGESLFSSSTIIGGAALVNHLAVNETTRTLYGADAGDEAVQVFEDTSAHKTLSTSVSPPGSGEVLCNGTPCLAEYDEGQEVILDAEPANGFAFKEWKNGTGSAEVEACNGSTSPSCTFLLNANSAIEAVFKAAGNELTVEVEGDGDVTGGSVAEPNTIDCGSAGSECSHAYPEGALVTLEADEDPHNAFVSWSGECDTVVGNKCETTLSAAKAVKATFAPIAHNLEVVLSGPGEINGGPIAGCEEGPSGTCSGQVAEGASVKLTATEPHYEFAWSGVSCTVETSTECEFEMPEADATVNVNSTPESISFATSQTGQGTLECEDATAGGGFAPCASSYPFGHTLEVSVTPEAGGWTIGDLSGEGSAQGECSFSETTGSCEFQIEEASEVVAHFLAPGAATLHVFKGGNGQGTVISDPSGIDCGTEPCEATYGNGEEVELEATAESGSVFAGWIGCKPISGEITKCRLSVNSPGAEVTAAFLAEGPTGQPGPGVTLTPEPPGANCANGGIKVTSEAGDQYVCNGATGADGAPGQSVSVTPEPAGANCAFGGVKVSSEAGTTYVCNGADGTPGEGVSVTSEAAGVNCPNGGLRVVSQTSISYVCNGATGSSGSQGPQGPTGQAGTAGPNGKDGAQGPQGPEGKQGPQGLPGTVKVSCKATGKRKITCTVQQPKAHKRQHLRWSIRHGGHTVSHGKTSVARLQFVLNHLHPGRYVLHIDGQRKPIAIGVGR